MKSALVAALAAPLAVTACAIPTAQPAIVVTAPAPTVTVTQAAPQPKVTPQQKATGDDATYLGFLASKGVYAERDTSIEVGHEVCNALDQGTDVQVIMGAAISAGFTTEQGAAIIAAAVMTYCPWNEAAVTS